MDQTQQRSHPATEQPSYPPIVRAGCPGCGGSGPMNEISASTSIVLNRDGTICRRRVGLTRKATFELLLKALL